ncbi:MAG: GNAT family N-acetyltransferase [Thermoproteota archaeon]|jgi:ribosomal protein S18 acetylase RimI-like enzyme|nr:GNAT family N-acetyltransferase [Thermoproteota archaeon]
MLRIRPIIYQEIEEISKLAMKLLSEPNVSDNNIIINEENRKYWIEVISNILARDRNSIAVAELDSKIIGYALFNLNASEPFKVKEKWAYISDLFVEKEYRRKEIGTNILKYIENLSKEKNVKKIRLIVWKDNEIAIKFYEKNGFKIVGYLLEKELQ